MIRRALLADLDDLAGLMDAYRQFYDRASDVEAARTFLRARMERDESVIFVALDTTSRIVGFTQLYPTFSSVGLKQSWILNDLFVMPETRRDGHGEALLKAAEAFSLASGARGLMLQTALTNHTAQRLYERLGWKRDEKFYSYYLFHS